MSARTALATPLGAALATLLTLAPLGAAPSPLGAQGQEERREQPERERSGIRFFLQPGVRTIDTFSDVARLGPATGFNVRFLTSIPTGWRHVELLVGATFAPFGFSHGGRIANDPSLFYGASVPLLRDSRTDGWLSLSLPLLGVYQFDETGANNDRLYESDLVVQLAATAHFGRKLLGDLGPFWSRLDLFAIADQTLTPNRNLATRKRDFFNPVFTYGVSIPIRGAKR